MNHASDLRSPKSHPICREEMKEGDRQLAALIVQTQEEVNCPKCRKMLGLTPKESSKEKT